MEKVRIGKITNTYALKGQLKVYLTTSDPEGRYKVGNMVYIGHNPDDVVEVVISGYTNKNDSISYVSFNGINDINQVEKYIGYNIYAEKTPLKEGYYIDDLLGFDIVGPSGTNYGKANEVSLILDRYHFKSGSTLIPLDVPRFIAKVDIENKVLLLSELGEELLK